MATCTHSYEIRGFTTTSGKLSCENSWWPSEHVIHGNSKIGQMSGLWPLDCASASCYAKRQSMQRISQTFANVVAFSCRRTRVRPQRFDLRSQESQHVHTGNGVFQRREATATARLFLNAQGSPKRAHQHRPILNPYWWLKILNIVPCPWEVCGLPGTSTADSDTWDEPV